MCPESGDSSEDAQPVGKGDRVVKEGECLTSIADDVGHFWETLWNDPGNAELKRERADPNVLMPGDRVTIPDLREKDESKATEKRHRFRRRGVPAKLNLQFLDHGEPRANEEYTAVIDGHIQEGKTDGDGNVSIFIPCDARLAIVTVGPEGNRVDYELDLGYVWPLSSVQGVQHRLANLGYDCGDVDGKLGGQTRLALADFQSDNDLDVTGEIDDTTRDKLEELHGS